MKIVSIAIICVLGLATAGCADMTLGKLPANSGSARDPGSFKGDLNNLGGPALNAPGVGTTGAQ